MTSSSEELRLYAKVNDINKWIFCDVKISRYLAKNEKTLVFRSKNSGNKVIFLLYFIISFLKLSFIFIKQLSIRNKMKLDGIDHLVLSTQAGHDKKNYLKYIAKERFKFISSEAFKPSSYMRINTVSFAYLIKFFLEGVEEINKVLSLNLPKELETLVASNVKINLANYSYFCAIFFKIKSDYPELIIYHSGATFVSSITRRVGIKTRYLLHGLLGEVGKSSFPIYERIFVYCKEEAEYLKKISPESKVEFYPFKEIKNHKKKVLIFLRVKDSLMEKDQLKEIILYFNKASYEVILKPHPTYKGSLAKKLLSSEDVSLYKNETLDATEIITKERPSFTVGWASTALCESLQCGVIPITLLNRAEDEQIYDTSPNIIYPIQKRCLSWHKEKEEITQLLSNLEEYQNYLVRLKSR